MGWDWGGAAGGLTGFLKDYLVDRPKRTFDNSWSALLVQTGGNKRAAMKIVRENPTLRAAYEKNTGLSADLEFPLTPEEQYQDALQSITDPREYMAYAKGQPGAGIALNKLSQPGAAEQEYLQTVIGNVKNQGGVDLSKPSPFLKPDGTPYTIRELGDKWGAGFAAPTLSPGQERYNDKADTTNQTWEYLNSIGMIQSPNKSPFAREKQAPKDTIKSDFMIAKEMADDTATGNRESRDYNAAESRKLTQQRIEATVKHWNEVEKDADEKIAKVRGAGGGSGGWVSSSKLAPNDQIRANRLKGDMSRAQQDKNLAVQSMDEKLMEQAFNNMLLAKSEELMFEAEMNQKYGRGMAATIGRKQQTAGAEAETPVDPNAPKGKFKGFK